MTENQKDYIQGDGCTAFGAWSNDSACLETTTTSTTTTTTTTATTTTAAAGGGAAAPDAGGRCNEYYL